jgi:hypothetical protein
LIKMQKLAVVAAILPAIFCSTLVSGAGRSRFSAQAVSATGRLAGIVVAGDTGLPSRRGVVSLSAVDSQSSRTTNTDDQGQFAFEAVPAGSYFLRASRPGYLTVSYGQKRPGSQTRGTAIDLKAGQRIDGLVMTLPKGAALSGTVTDDHGEPAYPCLVTALRSVMVSGVRSMEEARSALTDDRGFYRIGVLPPGEYVVRARSNASVGYAEQTYYDLGNSSQVTGNAATRLVAPTSDAMRSVVRGNSEGYYPGASTAAEARPVSIAANEERVGLDVTLQVFAASLAGVITLPNGQRVSRPRLFLVERGTPLAGAARAWPVHSDGTFEVPELSPGRYTLIARAAIAPAGSEGERRADAVIDGGLFANSTAELLSAELDVVVGTTSVRDLQLTVRPGATLSGTVVFAGALPRDASGIIIGVKAVGLSGREIDLTAAAPATVDDGARFQIAGVPPGTYRWSVSGGLLGWWPHSMMVAGVDTLDGVLEIRPGQNVSGIVLTLRDQSAEVAGVLQAPTGRPTAGYTVLLFPTDPRFWTPESRRIRATPTSTDGRFSFAKLPNGTYGLAAVTDIEADAWFDPAFLRDLLAAAVVIRVGEGEKKTQNLAISALSRY